MDRNCEASLSISRSTRILCSLLLLGFVAAPSLFADEPVSAKCPHVRILTRADRELAEPPYDTSIIEPQENQRRALAIALDALPPLVCQSVRMVVFVNATLASGPEALAWVGRSRPGLITVSAVAGGASEARLTLDMSDIPSMSEEQNEARRASMAKVWPEVIHSIIHEAYHSATHLIDSFSPDASEPVEGHGWPAGARAAARPYVEKARVQGGFRTEWARVNEAFEDGELGGDYVSSRVGREQAPPRGFMTIYGGRSPGEDIAEAASWAIALPILKAPIEGVVPDISDWKFACTDMQNHSGGGIPPQFVALYTKLNFLRDVGFITEEALEDCAGSIGLEDTDGANGFHYFSYENRSPLTSYTTDFTIQRDDDTFFIGAWGNLNMQDQSKPALTSLKFWVPRPALPRGYYEISQCNDFLPNFAASLVAPAMFRRDVMEVRSQSICAWEARVLVLSATTDQILGSAVILKSWKFSAPPVPETGGMPVRVIFKYER